MLPVLPVGPADPVGPVDPVEPLVPFVPVGPVGPVAPAADSRFQYVALGGVSLVLPAIQMYDEPLRLTASFTK